MSEDLYIGLSQEQVKKLLKGEKVGKIPYDHDAPTGEVCYNGTLRVYVTMLSDKEKECEPDSAFDL